MPWWDLTLIWAAVIGISVAMYVILDGFDLGIGLLFPFADDNARDQNRVWQLMKKIGFAMLVTHDGGKLRARPMSAFLEQDNNAIFFLTDADDAMPAYDVAEAVDRAQRSGLRRAPAEQHDRRIQRLARRLPSQRPVRLD